MTAGPIRTVWKYEWPGRGHPVDRASFPMPVGAEVLHVAEQSGQICLWARVGGIAMTSEASSLGSSMSVRHFRLCGTGQPAPDGEHVGTVLLHGGALVLHVFEEAFG